MPRYLGLDSSTQSLSAVVVDTDSGNVVLDESLNFGATLPEYASPNGFLEHADASVKHSNPLMWVDALDRLLEGARARGFDWGTVAGVSAPGLAERLRPPVASATAVGAIAPYFVEKYGFRSGTPVVAFTGDNPSSLVGMGATEPGTAVVSLGTSDTVFAAMRSPKTDPRGFGHVFGNPAGGFMCLICYSNGSLAREAVAKKAGLDWPAFERAILEETKPGNGQNLMLPFFVPEITPRLSTPAVQLFGSPDFVAFRSPAEAARAVVEGQALSMLRHSDWIGERPKEILVTGGAAKNRGVLQVISDVFQADLRTLSVANASALGGALRAANAVGRVGFAELAARFSAPDSARAVRPTSGSDKAYDGLRALYAEKLAELG